MRYIRTTNRIAEFIESDSTGKILNARGFQFGELYYQIKNGKVTFYLNDQENPWRNDVWTVDIPLTIDDVVYETEDEVSATLYKVFNDTFQEQLDELKEDLAAEEARAQQAEEDLDEKIDNETSRAISAETHLQGEITELSGTVATFDGRIRNVENGLSALTDTVNAEITRSVAKDAEHDTAISGLTNTLNSEIQRALSAEVQLHNEIIDERDRALEAESGITANLNAEISRSTQKDATHDAQISALTVSLTDEINRATGAENDIISDLNDEIADRISGDTNLQSQIDAEVARATAAESAITSNLNAEILRSANKDSEHDALLSGLTTSLQNEITRATSAETSLHNDIEAERDRALAAESAITSTLNTEISGLTARVAEDEATFSASLVDLNNRINAVSGENASQTIQISGLNASLNTEISRATGVENALRSDLTNETSARTAADTALQTSKADKVSAVSSAMYNSTNKTIDFKNISGTVISSIDARDFIKDGMVDTVTISNNNLVITFNTDAGKEDIVISLASIFDPNNYYTKSEINAYSASVETALNSKASQSDLSALSGQVMTISGDILTTGDVQTQIDNSISGKANSSDVYTKNEVDTKLNDKLDASAYTPTDLSNYYTKTESDGKYQLKGDYVTSSQMSAYTYDKATIDEKVSSGGSLNLPIYSGTGTNALVLNGTTNTASGVHSVAEGLNTKAIGNYSHAEGEGTIASGASSHAEGYYTTTNNRYEHSIGSWNVSNKANDYFGFSGNTLFSVGNGDNITPHNAFEIQSDGSIFIPDIYSGTSHKDRPMIKLQDALGGGVEYSAGTNVQINNHVISATDTTYTAGDGISISNSNVISTVTKFWCGTEQQWAAISGGTLDANTIYMVH